MPTRKITFAEGEYYHILARGVGKQKIFFSERDYARFIFYILFFQATVSILHIGRRVTDFLKTGDFGIPPQTVNEIAKKRSTELVNFTFMPNHIHLTVGEIKKGGISKMMQRALDGYTRYIHTKYKKSGHIFEGPFRAVHIKSNDQLLYLSTYIHKNPKGLKEWHHKWEQYPWSSHQDYAGKNRWGKLLASEIILDQFKSLKEYERFTKESVAKEKEIADYLLIDS